MDGSRPTLVIEIRSASDDREDLQKIKTEIVRSLAPHRTSYVHTFIEDRDPPAFPGAARIAQED